MTESTNTDRILNRLAINLGGSLLQYLGEASPWSDPEVATEKEEAIRKLIVQQSAMVDQILDLLTDRRCLIESGTYPTEFSDLQYLSLDFLLTRTVENAELHADVIAKSQAQFTDDETAFALVEKLLAGQRSILAGLQELSSASRENTVG